MRQLGLDFLIWLALTPYNMAHGSPSQIWQVRQLGLDFLAFLPSLVDGYSSADNAQARASKGGATPK